MTNLEVVESICNWYDIENVLDYIEFVENRLGQDIRYSISPEKLLKTKFEIVHTEGIHKFK